MALLVAEEAAALVEAGYRLRPPTDKKGRNDLVTEFDRASERLLVSRLGSLTPEIPVVGEEATSGTLPSPAARSGLVWYVDPIDGTTNFVHGHPFWCVSVGLLQNDQPVAGAVVAPALGVRWIGWVDPDSSTPPDERPPTALRNGKRCRVSSTALLGEALLGTGFPAVRDSAPHDNFGSFMAVKRAAQAVRRCGSAAIDLCLVADGTYDGYWERRLRPWDGAAGGAIVLAAGGTISSFDGGTPDYHTGYLVASNRLVHDDLLKAIGH